MHSAKPRFSGLLWVILFTLLLFVSGQALAQSVTLQFIETEYKDIFQTLGEIAGMNVLVDKSVTGNGTFHFNDVDLYEALDLVAQVSGAGCLIKGNTLLVAAKERMAELQASQLHYIYTEHIAPQDIIPVLAMFMPAENIYVKSGSNLLIIYGSPEQLEQAQSVVNQLDVPDLRAYQQETTVLAVLQLLAGELGLNLIADPSLASSSIVADIRNLDPNAALELIAEQAHLELSFADSTLVAHRKQPTYAQADPVIQPRERIKIYRLNHTEPDAAGRMMQLIIPADRIQVDETTKSVMIRATEDQIAEVDQFIAEYDQPLPQVLLEVWIHEMADDVSAAFGLDWSGILPSFQVGMEDPDSLFQVELDWEPWQVLFALEALEQQGKAKILARPKIATLSGQEAMFFVGDRIPIVLTDEEGNQQSIDFLQSGINLSVLPRISDDGMITIEVRPEVSLFVLIEGSQYPQVKTREARTTVRVKDGQPVLIGGLIQENEGEETNKVPLIGDLPLVGKLFQKTDIVSEKTEMTIILIPRIIDGSEGLVAGSFFPAAQ